MFFDTAHRAVGTVHVLVTGQHLTLSVSKMFEGICKMDLKTNVWFLIVQTVSIWAEYWYRFKDLVQFQFTSFRFILIQFHFTSYQLDLILFLFTISWSLLNFDSDFIHFSCQFGEFFDFLQLFHGTWKLEKFKFK